MRTKNAHKLHWRDRIVYLLLVGLLIPALAAGCYGPDEKKRRFFEKGRALQAAGETVKARLEYKNALQIDPNYQPAYSALGEIAFAERDFEKAYKYLAKAVEIEPDYLPSQVLLGRLFLLGKAFDRVREQVDLVLGRDADHTGALLLNAALLLAEEKDEYARVQLESIKLRGVTDPELYLMLATIHGRRQHPRDAISALKEGIAANPESGALHTRLAGVYTQEGFTELAVETIRETIRIDPQKPIHRLNLADLLWRSNRRQEARRELLTLARREPIQAENAIRVARFFITHQSLDDAETVLQESLAKAPKMFSLRLQLAELYLNSGREQRAIELLRDSLRIYKDPGNPRILEARIALAKIRLMDNDLKSAIAQINEVLAEAPNHVDAHYLRGGINLLQGEGINAVSEFRTVINERPEFIQGYIRLSEAHLLNREFELAADTLYRALNLQEDSVEVLEALVKVHITEKDFAAARLQIDKILQIDPKNIRALSLRGDIYRSRKRTAAAEKTYLQVVQIVPERPIGYLKLSRLHRGTGNRQKVEAVLARGVEQARPNGILLDALVDLYLKEEKYAQAVEQCRRQIRRTPDDPLPYLLLARIHLARENYDEAESYARQAIDKQPTWQLPHMLLAKTYAARGNPAEAIGKLEDAIRANPQDRAAYLSLGRLFQQEGRVRRAIRVYEKALEVFPEFWVAANNLAFLLSEYGESADDSQRAYQYALQAQARQPGHPAVMDTLGWIYHQRGEHHRSYVLLEKAHAAAPDDPVINYHFGKILLGLGMKQEAREKLERALQSDEPFPGIEDARSTLSELG